jgi:hypothetical protein
MRLLDVSALYLYPICGLVLMLLTWPMAGAGRRMLRRWGDIAEPDRDQIAVVVRYLRERRLLVVPLMFLAPLTARAMPAIVGPLGSYHLLGSLLVAWLLAEVAATVRPRRGLVRTASLVRREWLVPRWAVGLHLGLAVAVVLTVVAAPWAGGWYLIVLTVVTSLVVYGIAWLAMVRPAGAADDDVDTALRVCSARVALGVGILLAGLLADAGGNRLAFVAEGWVRMAASVAVSTVTVAALLGWSGVITSPRRASFV